MDENPPMIYTMVEDVVDAIICSKTEHAVLL